MTDRWRENRGEATIQAKGREGGEKKELQIAVEKQKVKKEQVRRRKRRRWSYKCYGRKLL